MRKIAKYYISISFRSLQISAPGFASKYIFIVIFVIPYQKKQQLIYHKFYLQQSKFWLHIMTIGLFFTYLNKNDFKRS